MNNTIEDATVASVAIVMENINTLPADRGRIEAFFTLVIHSAIESAIIVDRRRSITPSGN
jgi:hypothetical protein